MQHAVHYISHSSIFLRKEQMMENCTHFSSVPSTFSLHGKKIHRPKDPNNARIDGVLYI